LIAGNFKEVPNWTQKQIRFFREVSGWAEKNQKKKSRSTKCNEIRA